MGAIFGFSMKQNFGFSVPADQKDVKDVFSALRDFSAELNDTVATLKLQVFLSSFFFFVFWVSCYAFHRAWFSGCF